MQKNKQQDILFLFILSGFFIVAPVASFAVCPVCSVAAAGGLGLSRWLGIDDTISGIWIGGFLLSLTFWCLNWLKKKNIDFPFRGFIIFLVFYLLTFLSLYIKKFIGFSCAKLWGVDKLLLGIILGSLGFGLGINTDYFLRKKNKGRAFFSFQKVVFPLSFLVILSLAFYIIQNVK